MKYSLLCNLIQQDVDIDTLDLGESWLNGGLCLRQKMEHSRVIGYNILGSPVTEEFIKMFYEIKEFYGTRRLFSEFTEEEQIIFKLKFV